jgi:hypothetical protein
MERLMRATSPCRVTIPDDLIPKLRALRASQHDWRPCREVIEVEDVVELSHSLGPNWYLTFDGRFLVDKFDWDGSGAYEVVDPKKAWIVVVYAADHFGLPDLLRILPARPRDAVDCPKCGGSGWLLRPPGNGQWGVVCEDVCCGLGWLAAPNAVQGPKNVATNSKSEKG